MIVGIALAGTEAKVPQPGAQRPHRDALSGTYRFPINAAACPAVGKG
jgi:hypothetical protein